MRRLNKPLSQILWEFPQDLVLNWVTTRGYCHLFITSECSTVMDSHIFLSCLKQGAILWHFMKKSIFNKYSLERSLEFFLEVFFPPLQLGLYLCFSVKTVPPLLAVVEIAGLGWGRWFPHWWNNTWWIEEGHKTFASLSIEKWLWIPPLLNLSWP